MSVGCDPDIWGSLISTGPCTDCPPTVKCRCDLGRDQDYGRYASPLGTPPPALGGPDPEGFSSLHNTPELMLKPERPRGVLLTTSGM